MKIDANTYGHTESYPLFGEDGTLLGKLVPDKDGYLVPDDDEVDYDMKKYGGTLEQDCVLRIIRLNAIRNSGQISLRLEKNLTDKNPRALGCGNT